ncbi:MAG: helix-turn-helix domain-containing protein [Frankiaceae bacterium]
MTETLGDRLRIARKRQRLSQAQLAEGLPVSASYVSLIESGRRQPRPATLARLAERLGCSAHYLASGREAASDDLALDLRFAELALRTGDATVARDRFAELRERAEEDGERTVRIEAEWGLSRAHEALGDLAEAISGLEALATAEQLPGTVSRISVLSALCISYAHAGDITRAVEVGESALARVRHGDVVAEPQRVAQLASTLVWCYYRRGDLTRAHMLARSVIDEAERGGSPEARAAAYWNAAIVAEARGELDAARALTERALALYSETDNARFIAQLRVNHAWLALRSPAPDLDDAGQSLRRALDDLRSVGSPIDVACAETELARCQLLAGDPAEAAVTAAAALDRLADESGLNAARARAVLAHARLVLGDVEAAMTAYALAADDLDRAGASRETAEMWRELADALLAIGRTDAAMDAYRRVADAAGVPDTTVRVPDAVAAAARKLRSCSRP